MAMRPMQFDPEKIRIKIEEDAKKRRVEESKYTVFRVPANADARTVMYHLKDCLNHLGLEIEMHAEPESFPYLGTSAFDYSTVTYRVSKMSDDLHFRTERSEEHEKLKKENRELKEKLERLRGLVEDEKSEKNKIKDELQIFKNDLKKIQLKKIEEKKKKEEKKRELQDLSKEPTYKEKVRWFCEKYNENYDIMLESLRDDDLDNLTWKGEKVIFPTTRKELNSERRQNEEG